MPSGTPKKYEEKYKERNRLQRQEDEKQIKELLRKKDWLPFQETWSRMKDAEIEYAKAKSEETPAEELEAIARKYKTARTLCTQMSIHREKPKERLKEILKIMEKENLPAEWAINRVENRRKRKAGYRFNGKTREWYKPKEADDHGA